MEVVNAARRARGLRELPGLVEDNLDDAGVILDMLNVGCIGRFELLLPGGGHQQLVQWRRFKIMLVVDEEGNKIHPVLFQSDSHFDSLNTVTLDDGRVMDTCWWDEDVVRDCAFIIDTRESAPSPGLVEEYEFLDACIDECDHDDTIPYFMQKGECPEDIVSLCTHGMADTIIVYHGDGACPSLMYARKGKGSSWCIQKNKKGGGDKQDILVSTDQVCASIMAAPRGSRFLHDYNVMLLVADFMRRASPRCRTSDSRMASQRRFARALGRMSCAKEEEEIEPIRCLFKKNTYRRRIASNMRRVLQASMLRHPCVIQSTTAAV